MLGYLRAEHPGVLEPPPDGWHDTGDIVVMDAEQFITIRGRAKRFAKIAGEMVSLTAIEQICGDLWPEDPPAVVAVPDARKGERLVMVTTRVGATRAQVQAWMKERGAIELMHPSEIITIEALPLLGSGKTDSVELDRLVRGKLSLATGA